MIINPGKFKAIVTKRLEEMKNKYEMYFENKN